MEVMAAVRDQNVHCVQKLVVLLLLALGSVLYILLDVPLFQNSENIVQEDVMHMSRTYDFMQFPSTKNASVTSSRNMLPNISSLKPYFKLRHNQNNTITSPCNITGEFGIEIINATCKRPQFSIRLWTRDQVTSLKPTTSLRVPYVIYPTDGRSNSSYVSVTMLYCDFNPDNVRQNMLLPELVDSPQVLLLEKPPLFQNNVSCPVVPPRWKMNSDYNTSADDMEMLLALVRTELNHRYIPQRSYDDVFIYDDIPQCLIPPTNESICIVGDSHARTLQLLLHRDFWTFSPCFKSNQINVKSLYMRKQPCSTDPTNRILYIDAYFLENFTNIDFAGCQDIVITYGQWDLGVKLYENIKVNNSLQQSIRSAFQLPIRNVLHGLLHLPDVKRVYFLSMNYTPLRSSYFHLTNLHNKPRQHIRFNSPPFVDEFNDILLSEIEILNQTKIRYIDLTDIVGPVWDSAEDYNHFFGIAGVYMSRKVACTLFPTI